MSWSSPASTVTALLLAGEQSGGRRAQGGQGLRLVGVDGDLEGHVTDPEYLEQERIDATEHRPPPAGGEVAEQEVEGAEHGAGQALDAGEIEQQVVPGPFRRFLRGLGRPHWPNQGAETRPDRLDGHRVEE